jgi:DNA-binding transcriptional LysR family regulator
VVGKEIAVKKYVVRLSAVERAQLDELIRTPPADAKGLVISTLLEEELVVALPEGHLLVQSDGRGDVVLPLKALAGETLLVGGGRHGLVGQRNCGVPRGKLQPSAGLPEGRATAVRTDSRSTAA